MAEKLYHLTPEENAESILENGLVANEYGEIYAFVDMLVANTIAKNQVFAQNYVVFEIRRRGITGTIEKDNVAEFSSPFQRVIHQENIAPKYLKVVFRGAVTNELTLWDYSVGRACGLTPEQTREMHRQAIEIAQSQEPGFIEQPPISEPDEKQSNG